MCNVYLVIVLSIQNGINYKMIQKIFILITVKQKTEGNITLFIKLYFNAFWVCVQGLNIQNVMQMV